MINKITLKKNINTKLKTLFSLVLMISSTFIAAQEGMIVSEGIMVSCPIGEEETNSQHGAEFFGTNFEDILNRPPTAEFILTLGNDLQQEPDAIAAFQFAIDIWSREIVSSVPIRIFVDFLDLGPSTIAQAGPGYFVTDFPNAPLNSISYPAALANALTGEILLPNQPSELNVVLNSSRDFYFGTDGITPASQFDFVTVALHEIAHGLGFTATADISGTEGTLTLLTGFPAIYNNFITNGNNVNALDIDDLSLELFRYLTSDDLFFEGTNATNAFMGLNPKLEASPFFLGGSSISHLDEAAFPPGDINSLMTPFMGTGESNIDIGNITRGVFKDMGWVLNDNSLFSLSVSEIMGDLNVNEGENALQTVVIKNESDQAFIYNAEVSENPQNLPIVLNNATNIELQPGEEQTITIALETSLLNIGLFNAVINISNNISAINISRDIRVNILNEADVATIETVAQIEEEIDILVLNFENTFIINNTGNRILEYDIVVENESTPFLTITNAEGFIFGNNFAAIEYVINSDLPEGEYTANLRITSNASNTPSLIIPVSLIIRDFPKPSFEIDIEPTVNVFIDVDARDPSALVRFSVSNPGELPLEYNLEPIVNNIFLLDTNNAEGILQPGETASGSFRVSSSIGAIDDNYMAAITFVSNDPVNPEVIVPLNISLSRQRGRLELLETPLLSADIEAETSETRVLEFENTGLQPVIIENIEATRTNTEIISSSAPNGTILNVGEILTIVAQFTADRRVGARNQGTININSNATVSTLQGTRNYNIVYFSSAPPVDLSVSQTSISRILNTNSVLEENQNTSVHEVVITNNGTRFVDYDLVLTNSSDTIVSVSPTNGTLNAGSSITIQITIDGAMQDVGVFENEINVIANNLDTVAATIRTSLQIINPIGDFNDAPVVDISIEEDFAIGSAKLINSSAIPIEIYSISTQNEITTSTEILGILNGSDFSDENFILQPNESIDINFRIETIIANTINDSLIITSNASINELQIPLIFENIEPIDEIDTTDTTAVAIDNDIYNDIDLPESLTIAPNPVQSETSFRSPIPNSESVIFSLKNLSQQSLNTVDRVFLDTNGNGKLIMNGFQSGIYILTIEDQKTGAIYSTKVLKR